mgnify:CR=1 FL=1
MRPSILSLVNIMEDNVADLFVVGGAPFHATRGCMWIADALAGSVVILEAQVVATIVNAGFVRVGRRNITEGDEHPVQTLFKTH